MDAPPETLGQGRGSAADARAFEATLAAQMGVAGLIGAGATEKSSDLARLAARELRTRGPIRAPTARAMREAQGGAAGPRDLTQLAKGEMQSPGGSRIVAEEASGADAAGSETRRGRGSRAAESQGGSRQAPAERGGPEARPVPSQPSRAGADIGEQTAREGQSPARAPAAAQPVRASMPGASRSAEASGGVRAAQGIAKASAGGGAGGAGKGSNAGPSMMGVRTFRAPGTAAKGGGRAPASGHPQKGDLEAQISRGLAAALRQKGGRVTMRLEPTSLGKLTVQLQMKGERVSARFEATTEQARRLLETARSELRSALEARGLVVERVQVQVTPSEDSGGAGREQLPPGRNESGLHAGGNERGETGRGGGGDPSEDRAREAEPREDHEGPSAAWSEPGGADGSPERLVHLSLDVVG